MRLGGAFPISPVRPTDRPHPSSLTLPDRLAFCFPISHPKKVYQSGTSCVPSGWMMGFWMARYWAAKKKTCVRKGRNVRTERGRRGNEKNKLRTLAVTQEIEMFSQFLMVASFFLQALLGNGFSLACRNSKGQARPCQLVQLQNLTQKLTASDETTQRTGREGCVWLLYAQHDNNTTEKAEFSTTLTMVYHDEFRPEERREKEVGMPRGPLLMILGLASASLSARKRNRGGRGMEPGTVPALPLADDSRIFLSLRRLRPSGHALTKVSCCAGSPPKYVCSTYYGGPVPDRALVSTRPQCFSSRRSTASGRHICPASSSVSGPRIPGMNERNAHFIAQFTLHR